MGPLILILLSFSALVGFPASASRQLLLKIVGSIQDDKTRIVTNRDVVGSSIIDELLYNEKNKTVPKLGTQTFSNDLNRLLIEWMVRDEADAFGVAKVSENEVSEATQSVKAKLKSRSSLKSQWAPLVFSDSKIRELVARKLRANRFIKYKSNSSYVQVSDEEALEYFNKNKSKFGSADFENFKSSIVKYLGRKNAEGRLREWLEVLRKKHKVKNLVTNSVNLENESDTQTGP